MSASNRSNGDGVRRTSKRTLAPLPEARPQVLNFRARKPNPSVWLGFQNGEPTQEDVGAVAESLVMYAIAQTEERHYARCPGGDTFPTFQIFLGPPGQLAYTVSKCYGPGSTNRPVICIEPGPDASKAVSLEDFANKYCGDRKYAAGGKV